MGEHVYEQGAAGHQVFWYADEVWLQTVREHADEPEVASQQVLWHIWLVLSQIVPPAVDEHVCEPEVASRQVLGYEAFHWYSYEDVPPLIAKVRQF
jgi:hypothetical protein